MEQLTCADIQDVAIHNTSADDEALTPGPASEGLKVC
jgi:hypothetical protein